jgi:hypothetical protein
VLLALGNFSRRTERLSEWGTVVRENLETLGLLRGEEIGIGAYLDASDGSRLSRRAAFTALREHFA